MSEGPSRQSSPSRHDRRRRDRCCDRLLWRSCSTVATQGQAHYAAATAQQLHTHARLDGSCGPRSHPRAAAAALQLGDVHGLVVPWKCHHGATSLGHIRHLLCTAIPLGAPTRLCSRRPPAPLRTRPLAKAEVVAASSRLSAHVRTHTCCSVRSALSCRVWRLSQSVRHRSARSCRRCPLASAFCCCSVPELSGSRCMTDLSLLCRTARPSVGALVRAPVMNIELLTHHHPSLAQFGGRRGNLACRSSNNS